MFPAAQAEGAAGSAPSDDTELDDSRRARPEGATIASCRDGDSPKERLAAKQRRVPQPTTVGPELRCLGQGLQLRPDAPEGCVDRCFDGKLERPTGRVGRVEHGESKPHDVSRWLRRGIGSLPGAVVVARPGAHHTPVARSRAAVIHRLWEMLTQFSHA